MSMLDQFGAWASMLGFLRTLMPSAIWPERRSDKNEVRIETVVEQGPVSRAAGFTQSAVKITVVNEGEQSIKVGDIRLMFCGEYGVPVVEKAPPERQHPKLPTDLESDTLEYWYIPAEDLSVLLCSLHRPPSTTTSMSRKVELHARCISGTGKVYKSSSFLFPVDPKRALAFVAADFTLPSKFR